MTPTVGDFFDASETPCEFIPASSTAPTLTIRSQSRTSLARDGSRRSSTSTSSPSRPALCSLRSSSSTASSGLGYADLLPSVCDLLTGRAGRGRPHIRPALLLGPLHRLGFHRQGPHRGGCLFLAERRGGGIARGGGGKLPWLRAALSRWYVKALPCLFLSRC
jgi:hypothetical protein